MNIALASTSRECRPNRPLLRRIYARLPRGQWRRGIHVHVAAGAVPNDVKPMTDVADIVAQVLEPAEVATATAAA